MKNAFAPYHRSSADFPAFEVYTNRELDRIAPLMRLPAERRFEIRVVAEVLPFRVNRYVVEELIDWSAPFADPMFLLTFPQREMLSEEAFSRMADLVHADAPRQEVEALARELRAELNPHPAGQREMNVPEMEDRRLQGMQHKYSETLLFFPSQGQVCHSYCTFCFRWAQFVGDKTLRFASSETDLLYRYLEHHTGISDLLITGGDPMVMKTRHLRRYLEPLLSQGAFEHVETVRIGTKALTYWPYRFLTDPDADDLLRLMSELVRAGRHVAVMAHLNHWRELEPEATRRAIERVRATGAQIRCQGPLLARINDDARTWARLWQTQVRLGMVPYYMFVERDTGARRYFEVPLARAWRIYRDAMKSVSGLARTARGPSMSAGPGKVEVQGVAEVAGEKVFVLRFLQGRNAAWVQRPFFAAYDERATWLDDLRPAFGADAFFFESEYRAMLAQRDAGPPLPN
jgi:KamA family protein